jgi:hypothetical protein
MDNLNTRLLPSNVRDTSADKTDDNSTAEMHPVEDRKLLVIPVVPLNVVELSFAMSSF